MDAVIQGQTQKVDFLDPAFVQVMGEARMASMSVVERRTVTINVWLGALVENMSNSAGIESRRKLSTVRVLNAMHRPEDLFDSVEDDVITRLFALVICREAAVVERMPIFGGDDGIKV